jgi:hypothetical protein
VAWSGPATPTPLDTCTERNALARASHCQPGLARAGGPATITACPDVPARPSTSAPRRSPVPPGWRGRARPRAGARARWSWSCSARWRTGRSSAARGTLSRWALPGGRGGSWEGLGGRCGVLGATGGAGQHVRWWATCVDPMRPPSCTAGGGFCRPQPAVGAAAHAQVRLAAPLARPPHRGGGGPGRAPLLLPLLGPADLVGAGRAWGSTIMCTAHLAWRAPQRGPLRQQAGVACLAGLGRAGD